jgi:2-polyprenyl-3-methyl-5-hydroxy-6-metoxy-1,4-benzoquinol methylase
MPAKSCSVNDTVNVESTRAQFIERLGLDDGSLYNGFEAAIHLARYALARNVCAGARVLDIACGEGYGSALMASWGAASVLGVDISHDAVQKAQRLFDGGSVRFICASADDPDSEIAEPGSCDLIVSLETIEHLRHPEVFLRSIKRCLAPGGTVIISCPNDWWYYPDESQRNPYHMRKYRFDEFRELTESILGPATGWLMGGPITGFANLAHEEYEEAIERSNQRLMMRATEQAAFLLPAECQAGPKPGNASYFVSVWGGTTGAKFTTASVLPLSMDAFRAGIFRGHSPIEHDQLRGERDHLRLEVDQLRGALAHASDVQADAERQARYDGLRNNALHAENELLKESVRRLRREVDAQTAKLADTQKRLQRLAIPASRYNRLRSLVPEPLRRMVVRVARAAHR